jgi:hypothetical protein
MMSGVNCFTYNIVRTDGKLLKRGYLTSRSKDEAKKRFDYEFGGAFNSDTVVVEFEVTKCDHCEGTNDVVDFWYNRKEYILCWECRSDFLGKNK